MQRDAQFRGHQNRSDILQSIIERQNQYKLFIEPQRNNANLLLHLSRISVDPLRLLVSIRTPGQSLVREIYRVVNSLSSVPSRLERTDGGDLWLHVESEELSSHENFEILSKLVPSYEKLLTNSRLLDSGASGFMSVTCLAALALVRTSKYANS